MSALDTLKQVQARVASLHAQYQQIEKAKDDLISSGVNDAAGVRSEIARLSALKPQIDQIVRAGEQLKEQSSSAVDAAGNEVTDIESDNDDKLSDISIYAEGWPAEIDEHIAELQERLADGDFDDDKSARRLAAKAAGAHSIYR